MKKFKKIADILALMSTAEKQLKETSFECIADEDLIELESALKKFLNKSLPGSVG